jgi:hypothetical protein
MTRWNRRPWSNWRGDVVIERPERHYYPRSLADLLEIVGDAERGQPPRRVRACGSHWALSDAAASPNWFVETSGLDRSLTSVIPAALTADSRAALAQNPHGSGHGFTYHHVEGGVTISDLNARLDADPRQRWALPTMGGAAAQTLAGAISTGTHGGDHQLPPMADFVMAIHLVTSSRRQLWIERDIGITDPRLLSDALPDVEQLRSTELFNAALVAVGRMGIIYSMVVTVVEQFSLDQIVVESTWEELEDQLRPPFRIFWQRRPGSSDPTPSETDFIEIVMPLYADGAGLRTCYVTQRWRGADGPRLPPPRQNLFGLVCSHRTLTPVLLSIIGLDLMLLALTLVVARAARRLVMGETAVLIGAVALLPASRRATVGALVAAVCNFANRHGQSRLVQWLNAQVIRQFRRPERMQDVGYRISDLGYRMKADCYRGDSIEVALDANAAAHITFIRDDLFPALDRVAERGMALAGYISLRFTRRSAALLAMQRWDPTCCIEIAVLQDLRGSLGTLDGLQAAAVRRGGAVHWGQRNTLDRSAVGRTFPTLDRWRAALVRVAGQPDGELFDNDFCVRHGLEADG